MNIYIVTNEYSIEGGGLAYSCHAFVNMLEQVGHDITIISSSVPSESIISGGYKPSLGYELAMEERLKRILNHLPLVGLLYRLEVVLTPTMPLFWRPNRDLNYG